MLVANGFRLHCFDGPDACRRVIAVLIARRNGGGDPCAVSGPISVLSANATLGQEHTRGTVEHDTGHDCLSLVVDDSRTLWSYQRTGVGGAFRPDVSLSLQEKQYRMTWAESLRIRNYFCDASHIRKT